MLEKGKKREKGQLHLVCIEELVPSDHLLRKIEKVMDLDFVYELVEDKYSASQGRPSIDPVVLVKIAMLQYLFGIRSMRQTIRDIEVNVAYRWFLGMDLYEKPPHFTTFGKNYKRRFEGTDLFEQIFQRILEKCESRGFVKDDTVYVDATHIKASANRNKKRKVEVEKEAAVFARELNREIDADREQHGKKPFDRDGNADGESGSSGKETRIVTKSTTDPDSGMFVKGEHERSFAYLAQTACDPNGFILSYALVPGNTHDSTSYWQLHESILRRKPGMLVADAAYKTPAIVRNLLRYGILPVLPRVNPKTKKGFLRKHEFVYDEYYDCYLCPENQVLSYSTTNREGYREYKSKSYICKHCPRLAECTHSRNHTKVVTRHVWQEYLDMAEEIRLTLGIRDVYKKRKETIERGFADAKDKHGMRYTHLRGKEKVAFAVTMTFAAMNLKKMALWAARLFRSLFFFHLHAKGIHVAA